ncbi:MAG: ribosome-associated translation inhibitor RaiA [Bacilli bacterium]|nr:ribosome-associated translation inhibitor RaiA [Bacilli bacterium]
MKFNIHGSKLEITDAIKKYVEAKIGKINKYFAEDINLTANVTMRVRGKDQIVEITILADKFILRAEDSNTDLYAAIDLTYEKLERQIRKNKTKAKKNMKQIIKFDEIEEEPTNEEIIKRKVIDAKPMNEEEAILQMELIDHDFFLFKNDKTNKFEVVYKRKNGGYGVIEAR